MNNNYVKHNMAKRDYDYDFIAGGDTEAHRCAAPRPNEGKQQAR